MTRRHYNYKNGPAEIQPHSIAKHRILQSYLAAYYQTLVGGGRRDEFKLTVVDGFAGCGRYVLKGAKELSDGSPLILLRAAKEAAYKINQGRQKPVNVDITHFFIEADKQGCALLKQVLIDEGYGDKLDKSIVLRQSKFEDEISNVLSFVRQKTPRSGRSIFILDQYGYNQVPLSQLRQILTLSNAEIILTFGVDSLLNFANDASFKEQLNRINLPDIFKGRTLDEIKESEHDWRLFVQACLYQHLVVGSGAKFFTPFFIRNNDGHGDYWLLHLSQHPRARDVMTEVHWQNSNYFIHYGGAGLNMFHMNGYDPAFDANLNGQSTLDFVFDDIARQASISLMTDQVARILHEQECGLSFGDLFVDTCNTTPASKAIYKDSLGELLTYKQICIMTKGGGQRFSSQQIVDSDHIVLAPQKSFFF